MQLKMHLAECSHSQLGAPCFVVAIAAVTSEQSRTRRRRVVDAKSGIIIKQSIVHLLVTRTERVFCSIRCLPPPEAHPIPNTQRYLSGIIFAS